MMKNLLIFALLASIMSGCASSKLKPEAQVNTPAPIVLKTPTSAPEQPVADTSPSKANNIENNPLKDPNNILSKRSIYFNYDQYSVKAEYQALLKAHATYMMAHPNASIKIVGNADERGSAEYNLALGQKRSSAVEKLMNLLGIQNKEMETISYGKESPKNLGHDEAAWAENRRADIIYNGE